MSARSSLRAPLRCLARAYGVLPSFWSNEGCTVWADEEALTGLINALEGRAVLKGGFGEKDVKKLLEKKRAEKLRTCLPEVCVAFDGKLETVKIWLPEKYAGREIELVIACDNGESIRQAFGDYRRVKRSLPRHGIFYRSFLELEKTVPDGYHALEIRVGGKKLGSSFLISAPLKLPQCERSWGVFAPVHALRSESDWGIGSFKELGEVCVKTGQLGGKYVGVLPMLAGRMAGKRANISPYSPLSRFFWNEIFLDIESLPELQPFEMDEADKALRENLRAQTHVDYAGVYALKEKYIRRAAEKFFAGGGEESPEFKAFVSEYPDVEAYAGFRAGEGQKKKGLLARLSKLFKPSLSGDEDGEKKFHVYAQFAAHRQLEALSKHAEENGAALYFDYPVGVDNDGFDVAQDRSNFIAGYNVGAPPDAFSAHGQDWGFMPLHPQKLAQDKFAYFRSALRNYFRYAKMVRIDHIMGLYRIFCVPHGGKPSEGAYILYPFNAFLASLSLEAHRHDAVIIGEDLGTVPDTVREAMNRHGLLRMWLFQFYLQADPEKTFRELPEAALAALNTHDMFPFEGFWNGTDIEKLEEVGAFGGERSARILSEREEVLKKWRGKKQPFMYVAEGLSESPARFLLINLEDLWGEAKPQNMPGTTDQYPNWRKKFAMKLEDWMKDENVLEKLNRIDKKRKSQRNS